jgi:hypothetical protein
MNINKIHAFFVSSRIPLLFLLPVFILFRMLNTDEKSNFEFWSLIAIQIGTAFLLLYLNQTFIAVRNRTLLPAFFYLLFTGINPVYHCTWMSGIASLCVLLFFILLLTTSRQPYPQGNAFNAALILTLGSFAWQPLLFFFLILWFGLFNFHGLNFRTFFASLTGFAVIYLFIFAGSIYLGDNTDIFIEALPDFQSLFDFRFLDGFTQMEYITVGVLFFLFIIVGVHIFIWDMSENTATIVSLSFLYIVAFIIFIILLLLPQWKNEWFSVLCLPLSMLVSHLFSISSYRIIVWLMLLYILLFPVISFWG